MELLATTYAFGGLKLRLEPKSNFFASILFNYGYYKLENFLVIDEIVTDEEITQSGAIMGTGIELGMMTRIGPAHFTAEYNILENRTNFTLHLGYVF